MSIYKSTHSFPDRLALGEEFRKTFPNKVPVVVERSPSARIGSEKVKRFLVPYECSFGHLYCIIRKQLRLRPEVSLILYVKDVIPAPSMTIGSLYHSHHDDDYLLYVTYQDENVYGGGKPSKGSADEISKSSDSNDHPEDDIPLLDVCSSVTSVTQSDSSPEASDGDDVNGFRPARSSFRYTVNIPLELIDDLSRIEQRIANSRRQIAGASGQSTSEQQGASGMASEQQGTPVGPREEQGISEEAREEQGTSEQETEEQGISREAIERLGTSEEVTEQLGTSEGPTEQHDTSEAATEQPGTSERSSKQQSTSERVPDQGPTKDFEQHTTEGATKRKKTEDVCAKDVAEGPSRQGASSPGSEQVPTKRTCDNPSLFESSSSQSEAGSEESKDEWASRREFAQMTSEQDQGEGNLIEFPNGASGVERAEEAISLNLYEESPV